MCVCVCGTAAASHLPSHPRTRLHQEPRWEHPKQPHAKRQRGGHSAVRLQRAAGAAPQGRDTASGAPLATSGHGLSVATSAASCPPTATPQPAPGRVAGAARRSDPAWRYPCRSSGGGVEVRLSSLRAACSGDEDA